jgi:cytochrome P450
MADRHGPVLDWAHDFDHTDPVWVADPYPIWDDLRQHCPVAHTDRYGGAWLPVTYDLIREVAFDTRHFTSRSVVVSERRPGPGDLPAPIGIAPPITSDPPSHRLVRRMLVPAFGRKQAGELEPYTRELCRDLLDQTAGRPAFDAAAEYAQHIPAGVVVRLLGFPAGDGHLFRRFIHQVLQEVTTPADEREEMLAELNGYMDAQIDDHIARPRQDLTSFLLNTTIDGAPLTRKHVRGSMILLMIAGIDTTWSAIGAALWHLAQHPGDRRRLATEPGLMETGVEELLRAYAPVTMARLVSQDFDFHGQQLKEGDWVLLPFPAANRDPVVFPDPGRVDLGRAGGRHAAFGMGIHRCLGGHLATMQLRVALEEWLARYPDFELADPGTVTWSRGQVRGPRNLSVKVGDSA